MLSRIGLSSRRARSSASSPHGYQSTGLWACWRRYGLVSRARRFIGSRIADCGMRRFIRHIAFRVPHRTTSFIFGGPVTVVSIRNQQSAISNPQSAIGPMPLAPELDRFLADNEARIHDELFEFLRIPSVSARSEHRQDTLRAAEWLAARMRDVGLTTEVVPTDGHPIVVGEWRKAGEAAPTVLIYGHYDVQPAEPLELWESPPFEPTVRRGRIYARGAVDDKGQLYLHVKALEAHLRTRGTLPVNVIVLAEGEEEIGSPNLASFVETQAKRLDCDAVVISDSSMFAPGLPSILSSLRGLTYLQLDVQGPAVDLHSGSYGGAVINPATALARIIASFHDENYRVAIPGFYDKVREWSQDVRERIRALPFDESKFRDEVGAPSLGGEKDQSTLERIWTRPTCE